LLAGLGETAASSDRPRRLARGRGDAAEAGALAEVRLRFERLADLEPTPLSFYGETLAAYVALAAPRARAIYQVGHVRADGLSDLDLIVVPGAPRWDDAQFYSAKLRLPRARRLFPHDVRPLPFAARDAIRFTTHADRRLVFGEDVLAGIERSAAREHAWPLLLEGFLKYARFAADCARERSVRAERLVTKATSLAYTLALFDDVSGERSAPPYAAASLALRGRLGLAGGARPQLLAALWELFATQFAALERELAKRLPCAPGEPIAEFARAFLRGERVIPGLRESRLLERRSAIAQYHAELENAGLLMGSLFAKGAYESARDALRPSRAKWLAAALAKGAYRARALG
jgi:hypothetical protein